MTTTRIIIPRRRRRDVAPARALLLTLAARLGYTAPGDGLPAGSRAAIAELLEVTPQAISEGWNKGWTPGTIARHRKKAGIEAPVSGGAEISLPTV
jgi:hypothetical protein